jgi:hypothetical protein
MFVYNYDRPYPDRETDPRQVFTLLFYAAPAVALSPWLFDRLGQLWRLIRTRMFEPSTAPEAPQDRLVAVWALTGVALAFAVFLGWYHWRKLSPHWSQRDLFWIYYHQSQPDEPIGAYQMNWRGEQFYSKNTVREIVRQSPPMATLAEFMSGPGARKWILVEQARVGNLRQALGNMGRLRVVESRNNKFALTVVEKSDEMKDQPPPLLQAPPQGQIGAPP